MTSEIRANTLKNRVGLGTVSFTNTGPVVSGIVTIANSTAEGVTLEDNAGVGGSLKITTPSGYVSIGAGNAAFVHLNTDRGSYYFQKRIIVDEGIIGSYDENLTLQSPLNTNRVTINKDTGLVSIVNDLDVDGHTNLDNVSVAGVSTFTGQIYHTAPGTNTAKITLNNASDTTGMEVGYSESSGVGFINVGQSGSGLSIKTGGTAAGNERFVITSTGQVMIGTTTEGDADADNLTIAGSGNAGMTIRSGTTSQGAIYFSDATSGNAEYDGFIVYNQSSRNLLFGTQQGTRMRIDSSGHMGLGVVPSAWPTNNDYKAIQVGSGACIFGRGSGDEDRGGIGVNYYGTTSGAKYITNGHGSRIYMADGNIYLQNAASNSSGAGAAMTLYTRLLVNQTGRLKVNHTQTTNKLDDTWLSIYDANSDSSANDPAGISKNYAMISLHNYGTGVPGDSTGIGFGAGASFGYTKGSIAFARSGSYGTGDLVFLTNNDQDATMVNDTDEKMRITRDDKVKITGVVEAGPKTITGGNNLAIQGFAVKGIWSGTPSIGKSIELISGYDSSVKMAAIGYNLTDTSTGSTYGGDLTFHTQPLYSSPQTPIPESMRISSSGYVTKPKHPSFCARFSSGDGYVSTNIFRLTGINNDNFTWNTGGHYSTSTGKFTAPVAGVYFFEGQAMTTGHGNNDNIQDMMELRTNNGLVTYCRQRRTYFRTEDDANGYYVNGTSGQVNLAVGDTVWFQRRSGLSYGFGNSHYTYFTGWLIG